MNKEGTLIKLREIAKVTQGQSPESIHYSDNNGAPFLQGNRTFGHMYPSFDTYTQKVTKVAKEGEVLMSVRAPVGDLNIAPVDLCIGRGLASLSSKIGNNHFVYYAMKHSIANLKRQGAATTYGSVNRDIIRDFDVIVPKDKESWDTIASILYNIDTKVELNNKMETELEKIAKTVYNYWFVQFDFPNNNGNPYKSSGGEMVWHDELNRKVPEGWEVEKLSNHIEFERGLSYKSDEINDRIGNPFLNLNSFNLDGSYKEEGIKYFTDKKSVNKNASVGDLILAATDVTRNADIIGKSFLIPDIFKNSKIYYSMDVVKLVTKTHLSKYYFQMLFNSDYFHEYIKYYATGTLVLHLNLDGILWFKTPTPPPNVIEKFDLFMERLEIKKTNLMKENKKLLDLREWLLPLLMNGQITFS